MTKLPLLMTASVSTRGMQRACFTNEERETMYISAIQFYINKLININEERGYKIVFAENSGWDLKRFQNQLSISDNTLLEFISLNPNLFDQNKNKGYNEILLINYAIEKSQFIKESNAFLKVTGRYPVYNIKYFIDHGTDMINNKKDLYIDIKKYKLLGRKEVHTADPRIFAVNISFYKNNIANRYKEMHDLYGLQWLLYNIAKPYLDSPNVVCRFKKAPHYGGLDGTLGFKHNSLKNNMKRIISNLLRVFFPSFWF